MELPTEKGETVVYKTSKNPQMDQHEPPLKSMGLEIDNFLNLKFNTYFSISQLQSDWLFK